MKTVITAGILFVSAMAAVQAEDLKDSDANMQVAYAAEAELFREERDSDVLAGAVAGGIPATGSIDLFEFELRAYRGSYAIYNALPGDDKKKVYAVLKDGATIKMVRSQIINVRLGHY